MRLVHCITNTIKYGLSRLREKYGTFYEINTCGENTWKGYNDEAVVVYNFHNTIYHVHRREHVNEAYALRDGLVSKPGKTITPDIVVFLTKPGAYFTGPFERVRLCSFLPTLQPWQLDVLKVIKPLSRTNKLVVVNKQWNTRMFAKMLNVFDNVGVDQKYAYRKSTLLYVDEVTQALVDELFEKNSLVVLFTKKAANSLVINGQVHIF